MPEPQAVVGRFALGWIISTTGDLLRTLIERLLAAVHVQLWSGLARE
jgi:hypothetical protein